MNLLKEINKENKRSPFFYHEWMWKLYGKDLPKSMNLKWIMEREDRCEKQIWETTKQICDCKVEVVLDLGFIKFEKRELFSSLAKEQKISTQTHYVKAPHATREKRVLERNK